MSALAQMPAPRPLSPPDDIELRESPLGKAMRAFPLQPLPLLALMRAMCNQRDALDEDTPRLNADGLPVSVDAAGASGAHDNARLVFETLCDLDSYTTDVIDASTSAIMDADANTYTASQSFLTADMVIVPRGTIGTVTGPVVHWHVRWSAWPVLAERADRILSGSSVRLWSISDWQSLDAIIGLMAAMVTSDSSLVSALHSHLLMSATETMEPVDLVALSLRSLIVIARHAQLGAIDSDAVLLSQSLTTGACQLLTAWCQYNLYDVTHTLLFLFSDAAVAAAFIAPSALTGPSAPMASTAFARCLQLLQSGIEVRTGQYPATMLALTLLHHWIPQHQLAVMQESRRPHALRAKFPIALRNADNAAAHALFASLDLQPVLRLCLVDQLSIIDTLTVVNELDKWRLHSAMSRVLLLSLGYSLSVSADSVAFQLGRQSLRSLIYDWFAQNPALLQSLTLPVRSACANIQQRVPTLEVEDTAVLHCLYAVYQLLRLERTRGVSSVQSALLALRLHSAQPTTAILLARFTANLATPQSFLHALIALMDGGTGSASEDTQSQSLDTLIELVTPVSNQSPLHLFSQLSLVVDNLRISLANTHSHRWTQVWKLLQTLIQHGQSVAELLLSSATDSHSHEEAREEKKYEDTRPDLAGRLTVRTADLRRLLNEDPVEAAALCECVLTLWSAPSLSLITTLVTPLRQSRSFWSAITEEFATELTPPLLVHSHRNDQFNDSKEPVVDAVNDTEVDHNGRVEHFIARLSARSALLQMVAIEFGTCDKVTPSVTSAMTQIVEVDRDPAGLSRLQLLRAMDSTTAVSAKTLVAMIRELGFDLSMIRNPEHGLAEAVDSTGEYLVEVAKRLTMDDLKAAAVTQVQSAVAPPSIQSSQSTALTVVPTLQSQSAAHSDFLLQLARHNHSERINACWFAVIRSVRFAIHFALDRQPQSALVESINPFALCQALSTHLSEQRPFSRSSELDQAMELASLLLALLQQHLSSASKPFKSFASSVLSAANNDGSDTEAIAGVNSLLIKLLNSLLPSLLRALHVASPAAALAVSDTVKLAEDGDLLAEAITQAKQIEADFVTDQPDSNVRATASSLVASLTASSLILFRYCRYLQASARLLERAFACGSAASAVKPKDSRPLPLTQRFQSPPPLSAVVEEEDAMAVVPVPSASAATMQNAKSLSNTARSYLLTALSVLLSDRAELFELTLHSASLLVQTIEELRTASASLTDDSLVVRAIHGVLPKVLQLFLSSQSSVSRALASLEWLSAVSESPAVARLLASESLVLRLAHFAPFSSTNHSRTDDFAMDIDANAHTSGSGDALPAYLASGERNTWHLLWCRALTLLSSLTSQLIDANTVDQHSFALHLLEFYGTHRARIHRLVHRQSLAAITVARTEELEAVSSFIAAVIRALLHASPAALTRFDRREIGELVEELLSELLVLTDELVHLLIDTRQLESRVVAVSESERTLLDHPPKILDRLVEKTMESKVSTEESKENDSAVKGKESKPRWRPLRHSVSEVTQTPSKSMRRSSSESSPLSISVPASPAAKSLSFLLRSPVVGHALPVPLQSSLTADSILDAAQFAQPNIEAVKHGRAFFIQLIEFRLCSILGHSLAGVRETRAHSGRFQSLRTLVTTHRAAFNYRIRVIHVTNIGASAHTSVVPADDSGDLQAQLAASDYEDLMSADEYDWYSENDRNVVASKRVSDRVVPRALPLTPHAPPLVFQPPLSIPIDFSFYCVQVLMRLIQINPLLRETSLQTSLALTPAALTKLARASFPLSVAGSRAPNLTEIQSLTTYNLEQSLLLVCDQARVHATNLIASTRALSDGMEASDRQRPPVPAKPAAQSQSLIAEPATTASTTASQTPARVVALTRLVKTLEHYRERLLALLEETFGLIGARSGAPLERRRSRSGLSPMPPQSPASAPSPSVPASPSVPVPASLSFVSAARAQLQELVQAIDQTLNDVHKGEK